MTVESSTDWKEDIKPDEQELFERFAAEIRDLQNKNITAGKTLRGFHSKIHAGVAGEFEVLDNLPAHARVGVISEPRVFPAMVRFSNGESNLAPDSKPQPRGIAIKLIGVAGPKLLTPDSEQDALTQDFLATSHSVTSTVRDVRQFIGFVRAKEAGALKMFPKLIKEVHFFQAVRIVAALVRTVILPKVNSMATEHFSSTAPIQFGRFAVKFTVRPSDGTPAATPRERTQDYLHEELAERLRNADVVLDFVVQFFVDEKRTPIEDTSVAWKPEDAPFLKIAKLRIPRCNIDSEEGIARTRAVDELSFMPWHGLKEHQPLGNVMRARKVAYLASSAHRGHHPEPAAVF